MNCISRTKAFAASLLVVCSLGEQTGLKAEETNPPIQPPAGSADAGSQGQKAVRLSGTLWASYGIADHQSAFIQGTEGPRDQGSGFRISRALINLDATRQDGSLAGAGVRISPIARSTMGEAGATCRSQVNGTLPQTCNGTNDYYFGLYEAYGDLPLLPGRRLLVRFGQQHLPVAASPVHDLTQAMGHRFLDLIPAARTGPSSAFENLGFTSATDRGLSLIYSTDHGGLHLMLGNDGSGSANNGQNIATITENTAAAKLDAAARSAMENRRPLASGGRRAVLFSGSSRTGRHAHRTGTQPERFLLHSGAESVQSCLRPGHAREQHALRARCLGRAVYLYASLYYRDYGLFLQYTSGTGTGIDTATGRMTGVVTAPSTVPWAVQVAQYELQYYGTTAGIPASAIFLLRNNVDTGQARFQKIVAALIYRVSDSVRVGLTQSAIQATRADGTPVKTNPLSNVYGFPANGGIEGQNLATQMDQSWLSTRGFPVGVTVNDLVGTTRIDAQTAITLEMLF